MQHPAFSIRNFDRLPPPLRKIANTVTRGIGPEIQQMYSLVRQAPNTQQSLLFLPALWTRLDPAGIPSSSQLETLILESRVRESILGPAVSLETLRSLTGIIPVGALRPLWERVWKWTTFLDLHAEFIPDPPPELLFFGTFLGLLDCFHTKVPDLVNSTPGVHAMVAKAWRVFNQQKDGLIPVGLTELCRFIGSITPRLALTHLKEYIDGAGGTAQLAITFVEHINRAVEWNWPPFITSAITFVLNIDRAPRGDFHYALPHHGSVPALVRAIRSLVNSSSEDAPAAQSLCIKLLTRQLSTPPISPDYIGTALAAGLLSAMVSVASLRAPQTGDLDSFRQLLTQIIPYSLIFHSLLSLTVLPVQEAEGIAALSERFHTSPIYYHWRKIVDVIQDRLPLLRKFDSPEYVWYKACDNAQCGKIQLKSKIFACAGCAHMYYCARDCQRIDWRDGGHRDFCAPLRSISDPLITRDKHFFQALLDRDYHAHKAEIFMHQVLALKKDPTASFYVTFDYNKGLVQFGTHPFRTEHTLDGPALQLQTHYLQRRTRRDPRIDLHLLAPMRLYPMRSATAQVREALVHIAEGIVDERDLPTGLQAELARLAERDVQTTH